MCGDHWNQVIPDYGLNYHCTIVQRHSYGYAKLTIISVQILQGPLWGTQCIQISTHQNLLLSNPIQVCQRNTTYYVTACSPNWRLHYSQNSILITRKGLSHLPSPCSLARLLAASEQHRTSSRQVWRQLWLPTLQCHQHQESFQFHHHSSAHQPEAAQ